MFISQRKGAILQEWTVWIKITVAHFWPKLPIQQIYWRERGKYLMLFAGAGGPILHYDGLHFNFKSVNRSAKPFMVYVIHVLSPRGAILNRHTTLRHCLNAYKQNVKW